MEKEKIEAFYDDFASTQQHTGINERIYSLYQRMLQSGLHTNSTILELGCGIGIMSYLLSKKVSKGSLECVDLSARSVAIAQKKIKKTNVRLVAHDIVDYKPEINTPDFITLFDVIEHIPMKRHKELFENVAQIAGYQTQILINIPNPSFLEYDHKYQPEVLQAVDQPIPLDFLSKILIDCGLEIVFMETYSIFFRDDYQFFSIRKKSAFKEIKLSEGRNLIEKVQSKLLKIKMKLLYK